MPNFGFSLDIINYVIAKGHSCRNPKNFSQFEPPLSIHQVFAIYDTDHNGKLQYSEMNNFMKDLLMRIERSKKSFKKGLTEKEMYKYSQDVAKLIQK